jgi:hypothetical protein
VFQIQACWFCISLNLHFLTCLLQVTYLTICCIVLYCIVFIQRSKHPWEGYRTLSTFSLKY